MRMPADFHWIRPAWLLAIPIVVAVAVLLARRQLGAGHWRDIIDPALMPYVLSRTPAGVPTTAGGCLDSQELSPRQRWPVRRGNVLISPCSVPIRLWS